MKLSMPVVVFFSLCPVLVEANAEWQGHSGQWCLVDGKSQMCLPAEFTVRRLGRNYADFEIVNPGSRANVFLHFVYLGGEKDLLDLSEENEVFSLKETKAVGDATISWYSAGCKQISESCMTTIVLQVAGRFALQMAGGTNDEVHNLATRLANEWSSQSRSEPNSK